jgi:flagellar biosynthetic protein FliR
MSGLSFAQTMDPTQGSQGAIVSSFLSLLGIVLIFATGLHLQLIGALYDSYSLFPPGAPPPFEDFADLATRTIAGSFALGIQMAAPFIVFGLTFYVGLGILQRLIPQVQIFFISMPLQVTLALMLFAVALSGMMIWFLEYFATAVAQLRTPI